MSFKCAYSSKNKDVRNSFSNLPFVILVLIYRETWYSLEKRQVDISNSINKVYGIDTASVSWYLPLNLSSQYMNISANYFSDLISTDKIKNN